MENTEQQVAAPAAPAPIARVERDLEMLIPGFMENRQVDIDQLKTLLAAADLVEIRALAHGLKGTGGAYGFDELSLVGSELERAALADEKEAIQTAIERYQHYIDNVQIEYID